MAKNALLSASGAHRWIACPPSAKLEQQFPSFTSEYAEEGTLAHSLCEITAQYFLGEISENDFENQKNELAKNKMYSAEMQECAAAYAKLVADKAKAAFALCSDTLISLETRIDFSAWVKDCFGTSDCIILADDILEIIDFKYGKGVRVDAENNPQMQLYALGAYEKYKTLYDINQVRMTIFQPRLSPTPVEFIIPVTGLLDWAENVVKPAAKLAYAGKGDFSPSEETCRFCRAKAQCRARAEKNLSLFDEAPDALLLSTQEAGDLLQKADDMRAWLADLEKLVFETLISGETVPGWTLVE